MLSHQRNNKKTGKSTIDDRKNFLNIILKQNHLFKAYPLTQVKAILHRLKEAVFITVLDLKDGYCQVPLEQVGRSLTAFMFPQKGFYNLK